MVQMERAKKNIINLEIILKQIKKRDKADSTRAIAPLMAADDAVVIDSTDLSFGQVLQKILQIIKEKREKSGKG